MYKMENIKNTKFQNYIKPFESYIKSYHRSRNILKIYTHIFLLKTFEIQL